MRIGLRTAAPAGTSGEVTVAGKRVRLSAGTIIGSGGEAEVFDIGRGVALKLFKQAAHPDFASSPEDQRGARERIAVHQKKLPALRRLALPQRAVMPLDLAYDGTSIAGYTMPLLRNAEPLLRYSDRTFRQKGISWPAIIAMLKDLHRTVADVHRCGAVIGDFNDLNVLVTGEEAFLIDIDSIQFGSFLTQLYTVRFLDPLLTDGNTMRLAHPHNDRSDWYAYTSMVLQSLLFVDAWGGVFRPAASSDRIVHSERPLKRISIFHDQVRYPKHAMPFQYLPDDLLQFFHETFERDLRGEFPIALLDGLRWTRCACGIAHARAKCPACNAASPRIARPLQIVRGSVTSDRLFETDGVIVAATMAGGRVLWLVWKDGRYQREDGSVILSGDLDPQLSFRLQSRTTIVSRGGETIAAGRASKRIATDAQGSHSRVDANLDHIYWIEDGLLFRDDPVGRETIGAVLDGRTQFWVGPAFGFGLSRADALSIGFVFDRERRGINDSVALPTIAGELVTAGVVFATDRCWFVTTAQEKGRLIRRCLVIHRNGTIEAQQEAESGSLPWLDFSLSGAAFGSSLFVPTDDGIVRVEIDGDRLSVVSTFPDTESFVDGATRLLVDENGLLAVGSNLIQRLRLR